MNLIQESWKAVTSFVVTALITFLTSTGDGLSAMESARSAALTFLAAFLVWLVPYKTSKRSRDKKGRFVKDQVGQSVVGLILFVLGLLLVCVGAFDLLVGLFQNRPVDLVRDAVLIVLGVVLLGTRYYDFNGRRGRGI